MDRQVLIEGCGSVAILRHQRPIGVRYVGESLRDCDFLAEHLYDGPPSPSNSTSFLLRDGLEGPSYEKITASPRLAAGLGVTGLQQMCGLEGDL